MMVSSRCRQRCVEGCLTSEKDGPFSVTVTSEQTGCRDPTVDLLVPVIVYRLSISDPNLE